MEDRERVERKFRDSTMALIFLIIAVVLGGAVLSRYNRLTAFEAEGQILEARVVAVSSGRHKNRGYEIECVYEVNGREYRSTVSHVPSDIIGELKVGQVVAIEYLPDDPGTVRHHFGEHISSKEFLWVGVSCSAVPLIVLWLLAFGISGTRRLCNRLKNRWL